MAVFVVDTNVAIAANGRGTHADNPCRRACVQKIQSLTKGKVVVLDDQGQIMQEYQRHLRFSGAPGVGDAFFKYLFDHQYQSQKVKRVTITPSDDERKDFEELPVNGLDRSDRKFLAVAVVSCATIVNATEQRTLTECLNVTVEQLCPQHGSK